MKQVDFIWIKVPNKICAGIWDAEDELIHCLCGCFQSFEASECEIVHVYEKED